MDQISAAQDWLAKNPSDPRAAAVKAKLQRLVETRTAGRQPPLGKPVSAVSPPVPVGNPASLHGPLDPDPRSNEDIAEDSRHSMPAVVAHYGAKALPIAGSVGGGSIAALLGLPAGPGAIAAGAAGAGAGTGAGRYAQIGIDRALGYPGPDPASMETAKQVLKEAAATTALQGALGATGIGAGKLAPNLAEGKLRDAALWWAKYQGAISPAKALALKGTNLETLSPDVLEALIGQSAGGKGAVPAAGALSERLRAQSRAATEAAPLLRGQPLEQMDESTLKELQEIAGGGGANTPAASKALADDFRRRAQAALDARKAAAVAPAKPPDMGDVFNAEAAAARLDRQLPTAEHGAAAMENLPEIQQAVRGADLPAANQKVIDAIRAKLSDGAAIPDHVQTMMANLSPADKAKALKKLGISAPDDAAVQAAFDNLRGNVSIAGDSGVQQKATSLLDQASRERVATDRLQEARDAIAKAQATFGPGFGPNDAQAMGVERLSLADQGKLGRMARDRSLAASDAANVQSAFRANRDPLFYESQANMLDAAADAGEKAQAASAKMDALGAEPGKELQYAGDARSLDAFANANTKRGLQRDTDSGVMSMAALAGNRVRHAFAESSPWSATSPVPRLMDAARALESEALQRGLPAVDPALRSALQAPNNPGTTRAMVQALSSYLYGQDQAPTAPQ